jgi:hypothetical protein
MKNLVKKITKNSPFGGWGACGFLLLLGWGAVSCSSSDPEPTLPPATQEGKNTFGCKINGKNWVPGGALESNWSWREYALIGEYNTDREVFEISAMGNYNGVKTYIGLGTSNGNPKHSDILYPNFSIYFERNGKKWLYANKPLPTPYYEVTITKLDTINKIVAGRFHFMVISGANDTIKVTDGRFDLKYPKVR